MTGANDADFIRHAPCPECGSSDANSVYSDGHSYCFSCETYFPPEGEGEPQRRERVAGLIQGGDFNGLRSRRITEETCRKWGYKTATFNGKPVQVAPYYDDEGKLVAQKVRFPDKEFVVLGSLKEALPFGSHLWQRKGKKLVVTEGEIDALTMSQIQGNKWPVVSVPNGASAAHKYVARNRDYFLGFDEVVLMFDQDEAGRKAARSVAAVLGGRAKIASFELKDPNEMLVADRADELINAMWKAEEFRPEGIVNLAELEQDVLVKPELGLSWPFETLDKLTYGIRLGEIYAFGAGTGIGKTDFFAQTIVHLARVRAKCGVFSLEQQPAETARRIVGKIIEKPIHLPTSEYSEEEVHGAFQELGESVYLYDSFGVNKWEVIREKIEYLRHANDVRYFFLDHLTALAAAEDDERRALDWIMAEMGGLVKKLNITIFLVSHLATPDGRPHEEGGRVMIRHFRGSRAIGFWAHYMFGLERNQQADDEVERKITTFRVLKDRYTGRATGATFYFTYDHETGTLRECEAPELEAAATHGFKDETSEEGGFEF